MKSFYSILQVPIRPAADEQLNIGLLLVGERSMHFTYAAKKIELLKKLLPNAAFTLLKSYVVGLTANLNSDQNKIKEKFSKQDFVSYLSNYNNNLITFSQPTPINLEADIDNFRKLFEKFVFKFQDESVETDIEGKRVSIKNYLKSSLYPKIENRVNIDQEVTAEDLSTLLIPSVKVDFIGKNEIPVAGLGVDFEKSENNISNQISRFVSLIKAFDDTKIAGKYYVIGQEPDKDHFKEQHKSWKHIKDSGLIEFVDIDEVDRVSEYIESHNVTPFIGS